MQIVLTTKNRKEPELITEEAARTLEEELSRLGTFTYGLPFQVYVVGGLAWALSSGTLYRKHNDIDVGLFEHDLDDFYDHLQSAGYTLAHRIASGHISGQHDIQIIRETDPKKVRKGEQRKLKLIHKNGMSGFKPSSRMDYLDLFLFRQRDQEVDVMGFEVTIPDKDFYPIREFRLNNGTSLYVPNLAYMARLHEMKVRTKNRLDSEVIGGRVPEANIPLTILSTM